MRYCTRCGHAAEDTTSFCISCGAPLAQDGDPGWDPEPGPPAVPVGPPAPGDGPRFGGVPETGNVRIITWDRDTVPGTGAAGSGAAPAPAGKPAQAGAPAPEAVPAGAPAQAGGPAPEAVPAGATVPAAGGPLAGAGHPGDEAEESPEEDTTAWLPGFVTRAPALTMPLRQPPRPEPAVPAPPRHPLVLPVPAVQDGDLPGPDPYEDPDPDPDEPVPAWLKAAVAAVVVAAGLTAWYALTRPHPSSLDSAPSPSHTAQAGHRQGAQGAASARGASSQAPGTHHPAAGRSRPPAVRLGPGVSGQPAAGPVAAFLAQYFAAINGHDYPAFSRLFQPGASPVQSAGEFRSGYRSSRDDGARLVALGQAADGTWAASLAFRSHQDPGTSATGTACTAWRVTLYLVPAGGSYLIGAPPPGYQASARPCS